MEQYRLPTAMCCDREFSEVVGRIIRTEHISHIVETDTFDGNGSTRTPTQCFLNAGVTPQRFVTMEINWNS